MGYGLFPTRVTLWSCVVIDGGSEAARSHGDIWGALRERPRYRPRLREGPIALLVRRVTLLVRKVTHADAGLDTLA
jgi:hypothetical protein